MSVRHLRTLARLTFGSLASRLYLALVAAAVVVAEIDIRFVAHEDSTFAALPVMFVTLPMFAVCLIGGERFWPELTDSAAYFYVAVLVSALVQALALGVLAHLVQRRQQRRATAGPAPTWGV
ncbi:hypothetical protein LG634_23285 [Streptomyces bambusae]|uniref:SCO4225 family membrane protein n=1 Tax=Streptomyces bambusae TaxID=1550616 RepID=UPI001CFD273B|nr:hypothetical protein [Streptomyces bambusae]MCB5167742.1 hypothetical protein [Streptomyces bambusae]